MLLNTVAVVHAQKLRLALFKIATSQFFLNFYGPDSVMITGSYQLLRNPSQSFSIFLFNDSI